MKIFSNTGISYKLCNTGVIFDNGNIIHDFEKDKFKLLG